MGLVVGLVECLSFEKVENKLASVLMLKKSNREKLEKGSRTEQ